jgi:hypothetical protein
VARITAQDKTVFRSVARDILLDGCRDRNEFALRFKSDPRIVGFAPLIIQIAIQIALILFQYWLNNRIVEPSVVSNDLEPWNCEGDEEW